MYTVQMFRVSKFNTHCVVERQFFHKKKLDIFISISTVQSNQIHYKNKNKVSVNNNCIQSSLVDLNKIVFAVNRKHFLFRTVHSVNCKVRTYRLWHPSGKTWVFLSLSYHNWHRGVQHSNISTQSKSYSKILQGPWWVSLGVRGGGISWHCPFKQVPLLPRDLAALEGILMEGRGSLLLKQTSNDNRVAKFLKSVPKIMVSWGIVETEMCMSAEYFKSFFLKVIRISA